MKHLALTLTLCLLSLTLWACDKEEYSAPTNPCGAQGALLEVDGEQFCAYSTTSQAIIETGFLCPPTMEHLHFPPHHSDIAICSPRETIPGDQLDLFGARARTEDLPPGPGAQPDLNTNNGEGGLHSADKIDFLWVVDNSGSMCEEQQRLRDSTAGFIDALDGISQDYHMAVVTTDMVDPSQSGRFQTRPVDGAGPSCTINVDISHCPEELPSVLAGPSGDAAQFASDLGCLLTQGTEGYGFEMGLEAMKVALSPERLQGANSGFLRDDALLVIFFITDENDCSDRGQLDKTSGNVCEWFSDDLVPVQEYVDFLSDLKGSSGNVLVGGILGPDDGQRYAEGEEINPSCLSDAGAGYAGWRYQELMRAFQSAQGDICDADSAQSALGGVLELLDN